MKDATNHIIDEALNPKNLIKVGSTIHLEYAWSIKDQQTDSAVLQIPNALKVKVTNRKSDGRATNYW